MKLLYASAPSAPHAELKRLLLLATELVFMDRPSVTFEDWGTIGYDSPMRGASLGDAPIALSVERPPSGPAALGYEPFIRADLENSAFRKAFMDGLREDNTFAGKFIQMDANYGGITGSEIYRAIIEDVDLRQLPDAADLGQTGALWRVGSREERRSTLGLMLTSASIEITSAQVVAAKTGAAPIVENPAFAKLLALRTTDSGYLGGSAAVSAWLGAAVIDSVIPDEVVQQASFTDIIRYRKRTKDAHAGCVQEVERLSAVLDASDLADAVAKTPRLIATEVMPRVKEYRDELIGIRDEMFAELLKVVVKWDVPAASIAFVASNSLAAAATAFLIALAKGAPAMIDYLKDRRALERRHTLAYLLEVRAGAHVLIQP